MTTFSLVLGPEPIQRARRWLRWEETLPVRHRGIDVAPTRLVQGMCSRGSGVALVQPNEAGFA